MDKDLRKILESHQILMSKNVLNPIDQRLFGNWKIEKDFGITFMPRDYGFSPKQLIHDNDIISHLMSKGWMEGEWESFIWCYWVALINLKVKESKFLIYI